MTSILRLTAVFTSIAALVLLLVSGANTATAATTFVVTKTTDSADGACDADCSLREAIVAANAAAGPDRVQLSDDTYTLTLTGSDEDLGATGDLDVTDNLVIDGTGPVVTVIDAGVLADTVFEIHEGIDVTIRDLTITGGGSTDSDVLAGGILNRGSLTLQNVVVTENETVVDEGVGGVLSFGSLFMANSAIDQNTATGETGVGGLFSSGPLEIETSSISANSATAFGGVGGLWHEQEDVSLFKTRIEFNTAPSEETTGGAYIHDLQTAGLYDVSILGNTAGGIAGLSVESAEIAILDSAIDGNDAAGDDAMVGGLYIEDADILIGGTSINLNTLEAVQGIGGMWIADSNLAMAFSEINGNSANGQFTVGGGYVANTIVEMTNVEVMSNTGSGGGFNVGGLEIDNILQVGAAGTVEPDFLMRDSQIMDNEGVGAGGLQVHLQVQVELDRVTIARNHSDMDAGGVLTEGSGVFRNVTISENTAGPLGVGGLSTTGSLLIDFSTIADNSTEAGVLNQVGGIDDRGDTSYGATIVSGNSPANCRQGVDAGPLSFGDNIDSEATCPFVHATDLQNTDPLLEPLADNGGYLFTHAIASSSPALDNAACVGTIMDARGFPRPVGLDCDSGAYEAGSAVPLPQEFIWGDLNCSLLTDGQDAIQAILQEAVLPTDTNTCPLISTPITVADSDVEQWGDVNCDGVVDAEDAVLILRYFSELDVTPDAGCPEVGQPVEVTLDPPI